MESQVQNQSSFPRIGRLVDLSVTGSVLIGVLLGNRNVPACPFCGVAEVTLQKRIHSFEQSLVVLWVSGEEGDLDAQVPAMTTFQVSHVLRGTDFLPGETVVIDRFHPGSPGDLFLISANRQDEILTWDRATSLTKRSVEYLLNAPAEDVPTTERLLYFIPWLEDAETVLANDAFNEFANAKYEDIAPLAPRLPHDLLARWVFDPQTEPVRIGVYGMLLGLCGTADDAELMEAKILEPTAPTGIRLGIDGIMGGYLLLSGEKGLALLDRAILGNPQAADGDVTAAISALRFIWEYGNGTIARDRLRESMRLILARPERISLAAADLSRWQDWTVVDRLMKIYDDEALATRHEKTAIIKFLCAAAKAETSELSPAEASAVMRARNHLDRLREHEPQLVDRAERSPTLR